MMCTPLSVMLRSRSRIAGQLQVITVIESSQRGKRFTRKAEYIIESFGLC